MNIEQLIKGSEGLIKKIASQFYGADFDDLYQAGVLGVLKAYKNYVKNGNTKFSTYAYDYIYGEMYLFVSNKTIKVNKDIQKLSKLIEKTKNVLTQKYNRIPSNREIALFLNIDEQVVNDAILSLSSTVSLDGDNENNLYDTLKANNRDLDNQILISESMQVLNDTEKKIITARYYEDLTQSETARKLSMTQVMVSRYEKKSLSKMHEFMSL